MHRNSFDLLRLFMATAVIFSHSWGMLGLNDPICLMLRETSPGELAVCGFFIISGHLVSQSWRRTPGVHYFRNRLLRIVPGYAVAFLVSVVVFGALGSAAPGLYLSRIDWIGELGRLLTLSPPLEAPATFDGNPMPVLNGPLWTIGFEFLCYLLTPLLLWRRGLTVVVWVAAIAGALMLPNGTVGWVAFPRLLAMFVGGALLGELRTDKRWLLLAAAVMALPIIVRPAWELCLATGGAYLLLALGRLRAPFRMPDVSYGTYLYAWPIQNLLIRAGIASPVLLLALAVMLSWVAGLLSWLLVERWPLQWKRGATLVSSPSVQAQGLA